jgi:hypothetical protein
VADRLRELGYVIAPDGPAAGDRDAQVLLSVDLDGRGPWLSASGFLPPNFVDKAAAAVNRSKDDVRDFYRSMGFTLVGDSGAGEHDLLLTSRDLDSKTPFLAGQEPVAISHVCKAAARSGLSVAAVVDRLVMLGYRIEEAGTVEQAHAGSLGFEQPPTMIPIPGVVQSAAIMFGVGKKGSVTGLDKQIRDAGYPLIGTIPETIDRIDRKLATRDLDGLQPLRDLRVAVGRVMLLCIAHKLKIAPVEVAERLRRLGYVLNIGDAPLPGTVNKKLFKALGGRAAPGSQLERCISADVVLECAAKQHVTVADVCRRLRKAGVVFVDPRDVLPVARPGDVAVEAGWGGESPSNNSGCDCGNCD